MKELDKKYIDEIALALCYHINTFGDLTNRYLERMDKLGHLAPNSCRTSSKRVSWLVDQFRDYYEVDTWDEIRDILIDLGYQKNKT